MVILFEGYGTCSGVFQSYSSIAINGNNIGLNSNLLADTDSSAIMKLSGKLSGA